MPKKSIALPASQVGPRSHEARTEAAMQKYGGGALAIGGQALNAEQVGLITRTIAKGATPDELALFVTVCNRTGLDPFSRQIHAVKRWDSNERREVMAIQTGIDGYRLVAQRTGQYGGSDDYEYGQLNKDGHPEWARCTVYKIVQGVRCPVTRTAHWEEFVQTYRDRKSGETRLTPLWRKMPRLMLGKCAEAQALRAAFPAELSGVYTVEEMGAAEAPAWAAEVEPRPVEPPEAEAPVPADEPWDLPPDEPEPEEGPQEPVQPSRESMLADLRAAYRERKGDVLAALEAAALSFSDLKRADTPEDVIAGVWRAVR